MVSDWIELTLGDLWRRTASSAEGLIISGGLKEGLNKCRPQIQARLPEKAKDLNLSRRDKALRQKGLTVKRLERRLDCFRTGVGVLVACGTSMRSSFWLVLGVDGTDDE